MKKAVVMVLTLILCLGMTVLPAFAAGGQVIEYSWYREGATRPSGTLSSASFEDGWNDIMEKCNGGFEVQVKLMGDWIADGGRFTDDVFNGPGFEDDIIRIREGASVVLDLNGYSIDRGVIDSIKNGEVIHLEQGASLTLKNGTVIGSVHITGGKDATFQNCTFKDNEDIDFGAAIYAEACDRITVETCIFTNLEDDSHGAGIEAFGTELTVIGSVFQQCTSEHDGGAIYLKDSTADMTNCQFVGGSAANGGAVALENTEAMFAHCTFGNNEAKGNAGALSVKGTEAKTELYLCNFADNTAWENGGAIAVAETANVILYGCIVDENNAINGGAAYMGQDATVEVLDYNDELAKDVYPTLFINNKATEKGDVFFVDTPDGGIEEGSDFQEEAPGSAVPVNNGLGITELCLGGAVIFMVIVLYLNIKKK